MNRDQWIDLCRGRGKHVNPAIDCGGIPASDFAEDPDFAESYFRGHYDVPCAACGGRRVVPEILLFFGGVVLGHLIVMSAIHFTRK